MTPNEKTATAAIKRTGCEILATMEDIPQDGLHWHAVLSRHGSARDAFSDTCSWLTCVLALKAISTGNAGIGAVLFNPDGQPVSEGHNQIIKPHYRSDLHAEMIVINRFEDRRPAVSNLGSYTLFTSLEPCPMCYARLLMAGIGEIRYVAHDPIAGAVEHEMRLPPAFLEFGGDRIFARAACSDEITEAAEAIFRINLDAILESIKNRSRTVPKTG